jgi:hypothetical protein
VAALRERLDGKEAAMTPEEAAEILIAMLVAGETNGSISATFVFRGDMGENDARVRRLGLMAALIKYGASGSQTILVDAAADADVRAAVALVRRAGLSSRARVSVEEDLLSGDSVSFSELERIAGRSSVVVHSNGVEIVGAPSSETLVNLESLLSPLRTVPLETLFNALRSALVAA